MRPLIFFLSFMGLLLCNGAMAANPRVAFLNPAPPGNAFWDCVTRSMKAAAEDFDIDLSVTYLDKNEVTSRFSYVNAAGEALKRTPKPDYLIFLNLKDTGHRMLNMAELAGVKSVMILSDIHPEEARQVGAPRERFTRWIAHLSPDDEQAGYALATALMDEAAQRWPQKAPQITGILGAQNGTASALRFAGLQRAVKARDHAVLLHSVPTRTWLSSEGKEKSHLLLAQNPEANIVWAASDGLAFGALDAIHETGRPALTGGVDWTDEGLQAVEQGKLTASTGGHFLQGIVALVMIYDYHQGIDFINDTGTRLSTPMYAATADNAKHLRTLLSDKSLRQRDVRQLSKFFNKSLVRYDFSIENLVQWER